MKVHSHLVVNSPPHSVLGRIVAEETRLGQLLACWNAFRDALECSMAGVRAELAALRATEVKEKLFSFTVGNDIEPYSKKSVLELCWETIERVQYLNRRIALYEGARERIERSGKFHYFLIRVAGIAGGPIAESKAMHPRYDRRVRDKEAEAECPNYLIETINLSEKEDELCYLDERGKAAKTVEPSEEVEETEDFLATDLKAEAKEADKEKRFIALPVTPWADSSRETFLSLFGELLQPVREEEDNRLLTNKRNWVSPKEYAARHKNDESVTARHLPNWCPTCKQYVAWSHDGPGGINCKDHLNTLAEKQAVKLANLKRNKNGAKKLAHQVKPLHHPSRPKYRNHVEDRMVRCFDAAFQRWLTERKMVEKRHPNAPPRVRSLEKIVSESRYFPI